LRKITDVVTHAASLIVTGGPTVSATDHFDAEGFEKIEALIPMGSVATTVNIQPSALAQLQAIIMIAERYEDLTFEVDAEAVTKTLDGPLMLIGSGNIGMLGATVNDLIFTNANVTEDNMVTILVARTAIEAGP
jgi:hypothetical protein